METLQDAITLLAHTRVADALARLDLVSDEALVVLSRPTGEGHHWYVLRADRLRSTLRGADPQAPLVAVLNLRESGASPTRQLDDEDGPAPGEPTVVVHGDHVVGVLGAPPTRRVRLPRAPTEAPASPRPPSRAPDAADRPAGPRRGHGLREAAGDLLDRITGRAGRSVHAELPDDLEPPSGGGEVPGERSGTPDAGGSGTGPVGRGLELPGGEVPPPPSAPPSADTPTAPVGRSRGIPAPGDTADPGGTADTGEFRAHPRLEAPTAVRAGEQFVLEIGVTADVTAFRRLTEPVPPQITIRNAPATVPLVVQVFGAGLSFPKGIRRELFVPRDDPDAAVVRVPVVADPVPTDMPLIIQVSYEYAGNVCGRAWRQVMVGAEDVPAAPAPLGGGGGMATPPSADTPDLTVEIRTTEGDHTLEWLFHSRYPDVALPAHQVTSNLDRLDAKTFAIKVMSELPGAEGTDLLASAVRGVGREILTAIPTELWPVLEATWRRASARGVVPSMLLISEDPYIPWELASLDDDRFVDPALLPADLQGPACLGALWRVGRWLPPVVRSPRGGDLPPMPPALEIVVDSMAVVVGDYGSDSDVRPLPYAVQEGTRLVDRYGAVRLTALEQDLDRLLSCEWRADGTDGDPCTPQALHFACHGEVDLDHPETTGIILNDGDLRLTPLILRGTRLPRSAQPFVFLNACQVGTATTVLSEYGGMAGAFLVEGCRAFLAPLWVVDDVVARDVALEFYARVLDDGLPVAEAMRRIRSTFGTPAAARTATPLAYAYYGHPALRLHRRAVAQAADHALAGVR